MFNIGDDDKKRLRENMEKIKEMVNSQDNSQESFENVKEEVSPGENTDLDFSSREGNESGFSDEPPEDMKGSGQEMGDTPPPPGKENRGQARNAQGPDIQEQKKTPPAPERQEKEMSTGGSGQDSRESRASEKRQEDQLSQELDQFEQKFEDSDRRGEKDDENTGDVSRLRDEVPSPPKSQDPEVPDIDKGPLFLRQKKFKEAKRLVQEMKGLLDQVEKTTEDLSAGIQQDQQIEKDIRNILQDFRDDREDVERIISPQEE